MYQPNIFIKALVPARYRYDKDKPVIYLTFDDGPCAESTLTILDILRRHNVKATFFCIGDNVVRHPALFKAIKADGHAIGNHTMHHNNGFKCSIREYVESVLEADKHIGSKLFRPPYGRILPLQNYRLRQLGYTIIEWDVIAYDWDKNRTPEQVINTVLRYTRNGSIIVLHDSAKAAPRTLSALDTILTHLKKNHTFATL